jgi:serine/threonine protein kinase
LPSYDVLIVLFSAQHNVLIDDNGTPQLADFGRHKLIEHRGFTTATIAGSARQMAPELLPLDQEDDNPESDQPKLTKEADVYAFSMVALEVSDPRDLLQHLCWLRCGGTQRDDCRVSCCRRWTASTIKLPADYLHRQYVGTLG